MDTLPGLSTPSRPRAPRGGPVYQGVAAQVRALFGVAKNRTPEERRRHDQLQGVIAAARSLAASIDRVSGHDGGHQASGHQLSEMHDTLAELLDRLAPPADTEADPFTAFRRELGALPTHPDAEYTDDSAAPPSHPASS